MHTLIQSFSFPQALAQVTTQIRTVRQTLPLQPLTLLLPTTRTIHAVRSSLGDTMGVRMFQFYHLANAILDEVALPIRELNDPAIRRLLRRILEEMHTEGQLTTFAPVREKPGFLQVTLEWIREMKSQGIFPEEHLDYTQESGNPRDHQLAELYTRYQTYLLDNQYSDRDGLLWVAAETLEKDPTLFQSQGPLFILGFDQFTPVQLRILQQLASRFTELKLFLSWDEQRAPESLALTRLRQTRTKLLATLPLEIMPGEPVSGDNPTLTHLHQNLFETLKPLPYPGQGLRLIEAPSREAEARAALREVKRLLLDNIPPTDIALLAPNPATYQTILQTVSEEYTVSLEIEHPLRHNPAVHTLITLLQLAPAFPWQPTFEALRSPYLRQPWLPPEHLPHLDRLTRERPVIAGIEQWLFAVRPLDLDILETEDEDRGPAPLVAQLERTLLITLGEGLAAFFEHLTPPALSTWRAYTWWVQTRLLGIFPEPEEDGDERSETLPSLNIAQACEASPYARRDRHALSLVLRVMRQLLAAAELIPDGEEIPWETYRDALLTHLQTLTIPPDPLQARVRFGALEAGRASATQHLFILGLSEGEFPSPPAPDVFYAPAERQTHPLPLVRYADGEEASLWWQVLGNVRTHLTLLRPYLDDNGAPWEPSPYWQAVQACFEALPVEKIKVASHPTPEQAASSRELLVALAQARTSQVPAALALAWQDAHFAEAILQSLASRIPPGVYEGHFQNPALRAELAAHYGPDHVWSASRLNRYANCPYGFFAEHILKLQAQADPEEGVNAMQRGSLLHALLEDLYRMLTTQQIPVQADHLDDILRLLEISCTRIFPGAPQRYGFRPGALWRHEQAELRRMLAALLAWESENNGATLRFEPFRQETGFGLGHGSPPPLEVEADGLSFRLRGVIDRIDRDSAGNLRVIDYKSGSTGYSNTDIQKGLALQTALYALAAEQYFCNEGGQVTESQYWHIPTRAASGKLQFQDTVANNDTAYEALAQAARNVAAVRAGQFPNAPTKPAVGASACRDGCELAAMCRVTRESLAKAHQGGRA